MAQTIKIKRSSIAGKVPTTADLQLGELALNTTDGKLYTKKNNGAETVVELSGGGSPAAGALYNVQINGGGGQLDAVPNGLAGRVLTSNGNATPTWEPVPVSGGTVREVDVSGGATGIVFTGGPVTSTGTITMGGVLAVTSGGTGVTSEQGIIDIVVPDQTGNSGRMLSTDGTTLSWEVPPGATYTGSSTINITGTVISATVANNTGQSNLVQISDGAGKVVGIPNGTAGQVLRAQGGALAPFWDDAGGTVTSVNASGGTTGMSFTGGPITDSGTLTMTGTLSVTNGGTAANNKTTAFNNLSPMTTAGDLIVHNGTDNVRLPVGPSGYVLASTGTGVQWSTVAAGTVTSVDVAGGSTGLSFSGGPITSNGTITAGGTLVVANGGTGATTAAAAFNNLSPATTRGDLIVRNATGNVRLPIGPAGYVLASDGTDAVWSTVAAGTVTSVNVAGGSTGLTFSGGPITSNGTITMGGTLAIASGGTGATTASGALTALLPTQTGNAGKVLTTDGNTASWTTTAAGTVTSVNVSGGTTGLTASGGPITSSGTITLGGTLAIANGGTGATTATAAINALVPDQTGNNGKILTTNGTAVSWTTAAAGSVTSVQVSGGTTGLTYSGGPITSSGTITTGGILNIANGGTGASSAQAARNAILPDQSTHAGQVLATDGTNAFWSNSIGAGTVTSVNASGGTTGLSFSGGPITSSGTLTLSGTLAIANGGTGQTTASGALSALLPTQTGNNGKYLQTNGTSASWADAPVALNTVNTFTRAQSVTPVALTDAANITVDASLSNNFTVTLGGTPRTMSAPTNATNGQVINFVISQDATGGRTLTWTTGATGYKWPNGTAPTLSTAANAIDVVSCMFITGQGWLCNINKAFA